MCKKYTYTVAAASVRSQLEEAYLASLSARFLRLSWTSLARGLAALIFAADH